jgi:WhiB family redox-sensing transcriptional regulator
MDRINWLRHTLEPLPWTQHAKCRSVDPDLFFPERGENTEAAKQVCAGCPVQAECLEYALATTQKFGVWGGTSERERRRMRRARHRDQAGREDAA